MTPPILSGLKTRFTKNAQTTKSRKVKDLFSVAGKVALVTGGSRGIGLMIARGLVENGVRTYISSRSAEACDEAVAELAAHGDCVALPADLSRMEEVERLAGEIIAREDKLDILVNNAGAAWGAQIGEVPEIGWDKVMDLNAKSLFFLSQALLPSLEAAGTNDDPARIINIGSVDGLAIPKLETYSYPASKAAVHHLTRVLAHQLGKRNITVNAIAPGPFESKMMDYTLANYRDDIEQTLPRGRLGTPEDIAGTVIYLSSRAGAYTTGVVIPVDGGSLVANGLWQT
ncbi:MAG: SDR family oxidoreductase [Alphaproteobacteria bacterium]|nr:SDR family oxidoreductase [Alphaproteobacteria bacterium]